MESRSGCGRRRFVPNLGEASRRFDDDAHEVGLRGGDGADGLGFGERGLVLRREDRGEGGVVLEGLFSSEELLVRRLGFPGDVRVLVLLGCGDGDASEGCEAAEEFVEGGESGGGDSDGAVADN